MKRVNANVIIASDQEMIDAGLIKCNPREDEITIWTYEKNIMWNVMQWTPIMRVFTEPLKEDIKDEESFIAMSKDSSLEATVRVYELLGAEVFLYVQIDQFDVTARVNPRTTARPGDEIKIAFDLSKLHIFDKESELCIAH